jgi:AcrR family transcriptional regulator
VEDSRRKRDSVATRGAIFDAARDIFVSDGYDRASVRRIAERAGCSHGTLYLYFRDKDDLLQQLIEEQFGPLQARLRAIPRTLDPLQRLREAAREILQTGIELPDHFHLMLVARAPHASPDDRRLGHFASELTGFLTDIISRAAIREQIHSGRPQQDALSIIAVIYGVVDLFRLGAMDATTAESVATLAIERLLESIRR